MMRRVWCQGSLPVTRSLMTSLLYEVMGLLRRHGEIGIEMPEFAELLGEALRELHGARIHLAHFRREILAGDAASLAGDPIGDRSGIRKPFFAHSGAPLLRRLEIGNRITLIIILQDDAEDLYRRLACEKTVLDIQSRLDRIALEHIAIATATIIGMGEDIARLVGSGDIGPFDGLVPAANELFQIRVVRIGAG